ncbi:MAG: acyltransferase family protein [Anaerolineaceae bacterium]|nr:acyltransferase family protein [Anaerolineaceae bacterium]
MGYFPLRLNEIRSLTALRALAAALVFIFHYSEATNYYNNQGALQFIARQGYIGVDLFFVLSGFILTVRYLGEMTNHTFSLGKYFQRRVARIYPLYFTILVLTLLLTHKPPNITNLTLTQGFFLDYFSTGVPTAWTLTVEECFYLIFPLMILTIIPARRPTRTFLVLTLWTVAFFVLGFFLLTWARQSGYQLQTGFLGREGQNQNPIWAFSYTIFGYVFDFSVGIFVAVPYLNGLKLKSWQSTVLAIISSGGIVYCMGVIDSHQGGLSPDRIIVYIITLLSGLLILALTCKDAPLSRFLSWEGFVYLGRISFGLYLIQKTVLVDFMRGWDLIPFYFGANVMCAVLYQFVEEPARKAVMNFRFRRVQQAEGARASIS